MCVADLGWRGDDRGPPNGIHIIRIIGGCFCSPTGSEDPLLVAFTDMLRARAVIAHAVLLASGIVLALGSQAVALVELRRAYAMPGPRAPGRRSFAAFVLRRRLRSGELSEAGVQRWRRAGFVAWGGWMVGGVIILYALAS